jgi:hypothetical protein
MQLAIRVARVLPFVIALVSAEGVCKLKSRPRDYDASSSSLTDAGPSHTTGAHASHTSSGAHPTGTGTAGPSGNATVAAAWFEGWSSSFPPSSVPWDKYTHVTFSFACVPLACVSLIALSSRHSVTAQDGSLDLSASGGADELTAFVKAAHDHKVMALASIGGWTGSTYWSTNVASESARTAFVKTVSNLISTYDLDGVDFEYVPLPHSYTRRLTRIAAGSTPSQAARRAITTRRRTRPTSSRSRRPCAPRNPG